MVALRVDPVSRGLATTTAVQLFSADGSAEGG